MLRQYDNVVEKEQNERGRVIENPAGTENISTWVKEMGWAQHLEGKQRTELHQASLMPTSAGARSAATDREAREREERLARVGESFERVMAR